jgi:hypothetical protein
MINVVLANDTSPNDHHGCQCVVDIIDRLCTSYSAEIVHRLYVNDDWDLPVTKDAIDNAHLLLINGEGTIHHGSSKGRCLLEFANYAKKIGVRVVLFNATWQENPSEFYDLIKSIDLIYVRDSLSRRELLLKGIESTVVPDLTFYEHLPLSDSINKTGLGFTDSVYTKLSLTLYRQAKDVDASFFPVIFRRSGVVGFLKFLLGGYGVKNILKNISGYVKYIIYKIHMLNEIDQNRLKYAANMSSCNFLVCGRFHSLCFAIKLNIPFIIIDSNSHKIKGMLRDVGINDLDSYFVDQGDLNLLSDVEIDRLKITRMTDAHLFDAYALDAIIKIKDMFSQIFANIEE